MPQAPEYEKEYRVDEKVYHMNIHGETAHNRHLFSMAAGTCE